MVAAVADGAVICEKPHKLLSLLQAKGSDQQCASCGMPRWVLISFCIWPNLRTSHICLTSPKHDGTHMAITCCPPSYLTFPLSPSHRSWMSSSCTRNYPFPSPDYPTRCPGLMNATIAVLGWCVAVPGKLWSLRKWSRDDWSAWWAHVKKVTKDEAHHYWVRALGKD